MYKRQHLYGVAADGTDFTTLDCGVYSIATNYNLEAVFLPGVSVTYYVNGVSKGTITTNLPSGTSQANWLFDAEVKTNENVIHSCKVTFFDFWQEN